jgi:hypothetical protein
VGLPFVGFSLIVCLSFSARPLLVFEFSSLALLLLVFRGVCLVYFAPVLLVFAGWVWLFGFWRGLCWFWWVQVRLTGPWVGKGKPFLFSFGA